MKVLHQPALSLRRRPIPSAALLRRRRLLPCAALVACLLLVPSLALAHNTLPAKILDLSADPYDLEVDLLTDVVHAGQSYELMVVPKTPGQQPGAAPAEGVRLTAQLEPAPGLSATPVRGIMMPDNFVPGAFDVRFANVPVGGNWTLVLGVTDGVSRGEARLPLRAVPPPAIPVWLGWLVGLTPLYGLLWFAGREYRRLQAARRAR